jgi:hypothetical protein
VDLTANLILGGQNLLTCLNPEVNYLPYWQMAVDENHFGQYQFRRYCTGHNVGRWWNTMLRLERSTGFEIPEEVESAMLAKLLDQLEKIDGDLGEGEFVLIENEKGEDYPRTRTRMKDVVVDGDNRFHFYSSVSSPLKVGVFKAS